MKTNEKIELSSYLRTEGLTLAQVLPSHQDEGPVVLLVDAAKRLSALIGERVLDRKAA